MPMIALLCALFFFGYLAIRLYWQAIAFLALGAGYQLLGYMVPTPDPYGMATDSATLILVCMSSIAGFIAWRLTRAQMEDGLLTKSRIGVFMGIGANVMIAAFILWQTGTLVLPT